MALINCVINFILTWSESCVICSANGPTKFTITNTKLYVPVVTLTTENNIKLLKQLESGFKRTAHWNIYQFKLTKQTQNRYLDYLIDPSFQGVNRISVLSLENKNDRNIHIGYFLPKVEIKDYNVVVDGRNFFHQAIKNDKITYDNIRQTAASQGDDYTTRCLLDYIYFIKI